ncbi:ABC transporter permease [Oceaniovalibus guishaninsula]|nr:ABC transporter permease [Oceaniovalibus guishaninsula]
MIWDATFFESVPRFVTPLLLASLGGALCHRAGVFNIALEGMMLIGAFFAVVGSYFTAHWLGGLGAAVASGLAAGALYAWVGVRRGGDDIVVSIGLNILAAGLTAFLLRAIFDQRGQFDDPAIATLPRIALPGIDAVASLGPLLSGQSVLFWAALALVPLLAWGLTRHRLGLRMRAAGDNPAALRTLGVAPERIRTVAVLGSGALCALAGAQLSISNVSLFTEGMSAGRGWIAVVIVMMCAGRPVWILPAALFFGLIDALAVRAQVFGLPQQLTEALPYGLAIAVMAVALRRAAFRVRT